MSDTPRTDEMAEKHPSWPNTAVHFACNLERQLAEVTKQRDEAKAEMWKARNALKKVTGALRHITNDFSAFKHYAQTKNNFGGSYGIYSIDRAKMALADARKLIAAAKGGEL